MRQVSTNFLDAVRGSHKAIFRARICAPGQTGNNPTALVSDLPILGGDVTFDCQADVNASLNLDVSYDWPFTYANPISPYGNEIYVERGIEYGNGIKEFVGLGYFRIDTVEQESSPNGALRITGSDRMAVVRDGRPTSPVQFSSGSSVGFVIDQAMSAVVPGFVSVYDFSAYTTLLTSDHIMTDDRLKFVQDIVSSYGKIAYFDYQGKLQVKTPPTPISTTVFTINAGRNGVLVSMKRAVTRESIYNGVVASGEASGEEPPVFAVVTDNNPASPTYWLGPFGKVPRFFSSSFMTTVDQCVNAAANMLAGTTGLPYNVTLGVVPNPALEGWDPIKVVYSDGATAENHLIDTVSYALSVDGEMSITTRRQFL